MGGKDVSSGLTTPAISDSEHGVTSGGASPSAAQPQSLVTRRENKAVPIYACCATNDAEVVDLVLSIYFRRDRLPDPQELLMCTENTTAEEIDILIRRFIQAKQHSRGNSVYCLGNIQLLNYQLQCRAVEILGVLLGEFGVDNAASLVIVSGNPNQMLITAATSQCGVQFINVTPLPAKDLTLCLKHASPAVSAVMTQDINGSGKTDYIMQEAYNVQ